MSGFESERFFQVWAFTVSKTKLLLRSTNDGGRSTRIDVYFGGVDRMFLKSEYHGLRVAEADRVDLELYRERYGDLRPGLTLFAVEPRLESFVVAGVMQWHEDNGGFRDPSRFGHFLGA
jgi:hypothetical protein